MDVLWVMFENSRIFISADQGETWTQRQMPPYRRPGALMSFVDNKRGWMLFPSEGGGSCESAGAQIVAHERWRGDVAASR